MPGKRDHLWDAVSRKALVDALREIFNRHCKPLTPGSVKTHEVGGTGKIVEVSRNGDGTIAAATVRQV